MIVNKVLQKATRRFPTPLTSLLITIVISLPGILLALFLANRHPQLYYDIEASTSVLDIKEELPKLNILFDGIDIRQQNLSLRIISVKVINDSSKGILKKEITTKRTL